MKKLIAFGAIVLSSLVLGTNSQAHHQPGLHNIKHAINLHFCGHVNKICNYGNQALRVVWCESRYNVNAVNGQYRGLFQMGSSERKLYGHGNNPWAQAKAANRYFVLSGRDWSPWECKWAAY